MTEMLGEFRPIGGTNNNLVDPSLNATPGTAELRIGPANFTPGTTDGMIDSGPNPRTLSNVVSGGPHAADADPTASGWLYVFGQFVDHDLDLEAVGGADMGIPVPAGDQNIAAGVIPVTRAIKDDHGNVKNTVASNLDLSQVYGSDQAKADSLRNADGTMKTSDGNALSMVNGQFVAGDVRVMENPELTAVTTLFVREHNQWVSALAKENPKLTGDQLYNMAKAITTGEYQNIVFNEYLPTLIGKDTIKPYAGYDPSVNTKITQEFSTSAFRVGHSQVSDEQAGQDNNGNETFHQTLSESFQNPAALTLSNGMDGLLRHLSSETSQATDPYAIDGLRNLLFAPPQFLDLIAIDIARERDLGIGSLNQTREALGLKPYASIDELTSDKEVAANLKSQFGTIDKVDLFLGGLAENHAAQGVVGETFQRIIGDQFTALRDGDRFWWQNQGFDQATQDQISKATLSDVLQRNTDTKGLQANVFVAQGRHGSDMAAEEPDGPQLVVGTDDRKGAISGGPADDTIVSGAGLHQVMTGGGGADTFQFVGNGHHDKIADWTGADTLQFTKLDDVGATMLTVRDTTRGAVVQFGDNRILLSGVQAGTLTEGNFMFSGLGTVPEIKIGAV